MAFQNITLTNFDIANIQLERAIRLFMVEEDFVSSLTLAGAAEEILAKLLPKEGPRPALGEAIKQSREMQRLFGFKESSFKEAAEVANFWRNSFKHCKLDQAATLSVDFAAAEMIKRAVENYFKLTRGKSESMTEFLRHLEHRFKFTVGDINA